MRRRFGHGIIWHGMALQSFVSALAVWHRGTDAAMASWQARRVDPTLMAIKERGGSSRYSNRMGTRYTL